MTRQGLPPKDQRVLLDSLREQGCTVIVTSSGWRILCPDGVTTIGIHRTHGGGRARHNLRAQVRRAGLHWPFDGKRDSA